jgi:hypothetical protein
MSLNASHARSALTLPVVSTLAILTLFLASPLEAACPPGDSNPVTSGDPSLGPIVVLGGLGPAPVGSFFLAGSGAANNSGTLPSSLWLERIGDLDGDGLPEIRVSAPGEGPGGWGDPLTQGCPSSASPPHPPLVLFVRHDNEDLDGDGKFDVWEDRTGPPCVRDPVTGQIISYGADLDCDGHFTPPAIRGVGGGCEGAGREDIDCDGRLDRGTEDLNGNGKLDPGEDRDSDGHLDTINEDRNENFLLDDRPDPSINNDLIPDENGEFGNFYPYMAARPATGSFVIVAVAWNGQAHDLQSSNLPTTTALEDLDRDGAWDVFEDRNRNGRLDLDEDLDGDGRLTPPGGCEGATREDKDCDGRLDLVNEDLDHNGRLDPGEDVDADGRLDDGTEDRNHDQLLNDRPFPSPDDVIFYYSPSGHSAPLSPTYPYGSFTPADEVRVIAAHPLPTVPPQGCPVAGGPGRPLLDIASIGTLQSGTLDARVSISDPDADPLSGRVTIEALLQLPDLASGGSDLCAGPLLPDGARGQGALFVGSVGLPMLFDLDSITGCDDGQPDFGFTYGACGSPSGPAQTVLTLSCPAPFPICVRRLDGSGEFDYVVHQADALAAVVSGSSPAFPAASYDGSLLPRSFDLRALPEPGTYALTITASDGVTPIATDSMLFGWNGQKTLYINHPGHRAGLGPVLGPEPLPGPAPTPVPVDN